MRETPWGITCLAVAEKVASNEGMVLEFNSLLVVLRLYFFVMTEPFNAIFKNPT